MSSQRASRPRFKEEPGGASGSTPHHPATLAHVRSCDHCAGLVGLALVYLEPGTRVVAHETPGVARIDLRFAAGVFWLLAGEELVEVTRNEQRALDLAARLAVEALTPEAPAVRLERIDGGFRVVEGHKELARARNPSRLRDALQLADEWGWEDGA